VNNTEASSRRKVITSLADGPRTLPADAKVRDGTPAWRLRGAGPALDDRLRRM
jgi:hypothetical protein